MTYEDLLKDINKGKIAPSYLFVGEEEALKRDAVLRIKKKTGANFVIFDETKDIKEVFSPDIFGEKKIVLIKSFSEKDFIMKYINNPSPDIILIISLKKIDEKLTNLSVASFPKPYGERLKHWIRERFRGYERKITDSAINLLLETVGEDIDFLIPEIEKITLFSEKQELSESDILPILSKRLSKDIFDLLDAIGERKKSALSICNSLLSYGTSPGQILFMIEKRMREIFSLKDGIKEPTMRDWQYRKIAIYEKLFSKEEAYPIFSNLADCDLKLKSYSSNSRNIILLSSIYRLIIQKNRQLSCCY